MRPLGIIITILIIGVAIAFILTNYSPQKDKTLYNVSVSANYNDQKVITGINVNGQTINTSQYYEMIQLPEGLATFTNKNIKDQIYYENPYTYNITGNQRVDIFLDKPILPTITITHINPIIISISSSNFKGASFCLFSSVNFIFVKANYTQIRIPNKYSTADICYGTWDLTDTQSFEIDYTPLSNPTEDDFLNLTIYDKAGNEVTKRLF